ncbi:MAG: hypothetical protein LBD23_19545 [Oscillospiraceae bacterium]|jgi:RNA polymerase subunit RPABC4/transcription elongation factor Spt4|nr:hypothetical protein [Oscillospiraceae bacterium]
MKEKKCWKCKRILDRGFGLCSRCKNQFGTVAFTLGAAVVVGLVRNSIERIKLK